MTQHGSTRECALCHVEKSESDFASSAHAECRTCMYKNVMAKEAVDHPAHYGGDTVYETIKVLKAWLTPEEYRGFLKGNAIKYLSRAGKKGSAEEDQKKAEWYIKELNKC